MGTHAKGSVGTDHIYIHLALCHNVLSCNAHVHVTLTDICRNVGSGQELHKMQSFVCMRAGGWSAPR